MCTALVCGTCGVGGGRGVHVFPSGLVHVSYSLWLSLRGVRWAMWV